MNTKLILAIPTIVLMSLALSACSSAPRVPTPENTSDKIVSTSKDSSSDHPGWLRDLEEKPFQVDGGVVTVLGQTQIPLDHRLEAAYRIADLDAKRLLCEAISQRLSFVMDHAEEGTSMSDIQSRYIAASACKLTSSNLRPGKRYHEKVTEATDGGTMRTYYRVFSTQAMQEVEFQRHVLQAAKNAEGKQGISAGFSKIVDRHWSEFIAEGASRAEEREPTSSEEATVDAAD